jgi:uncharacterized membrane protein YfcA
VDSFPVGFAVVLFVAFVVESAVGFGSALIAVSLGGQLLPLDHLFPIFQPLSLALSTVLVLTGRPHVDVRIVCLRALPAMVPGVLLGRWLFHLGAPETLLVGVGAAIAVLAAFELVSTLRGRAARPLPSTTTMTVLLGAGIVHGLFGTSGPPVVWVASRVVPEKARMRATLALLWLLLSVILVVTWVADGKLGPAQLQQSALLSLPLIAGFVVGNLLHERVPQRQFRIAVCVLLVCAGLALVVRAWPLGA